MVSVGACGFQPKKTLCFDKMHTPSHQQTARPWDLGPVLSQPSTNGSGFGSHARPDERNDPNEFCHQSHSLKVGWSAEGATGTSCNWAGHIQKKSSRYFWGVDTFGSSCSGSILNSRGLSLDTCIFSWCWCQERRFTWCASTFNQCVVFLSVIWCYDLLLCADLIWEVNWKIISPIELCPASGADVMLLTKPWAINLAKAGGGPASHISLPEDPTGQSHSAPQFLIHAS